MALIHCSFRIQYPNDFPIDSQTHCYYHNMYGKLTIRLKSPLYICKLYWNNEMHNRVMLDIFVGKYMELMMNDMDGGMLLLSTSLR